MAKETHNDKLKVQIGRVTASAKSDNYFPLIGDTIKIDVETRWGQTSEWETKDGGGSTLTAAGNLVHDKDSKSIKILAEGELHQKFIGRNKLFTTEVVKAIYAMAPQALPYFEVTSNNEIVRVGEQYATISVTPENGYTGPLKEATTVRIYRENEEISPICTLNVSTGRPLPDGTITFVTTFDKASDRGIYDVEVDVTDAASGVTMTKRKNKLITVTPKLCPQPADRTDGYEVAATYTAYTSYLVMPLVQTFEIRLWRDVDGSGLNYAEMIIPSGNPDNAHWWSVDISVLPEGTTLCLKKDPMETAPYPMRLFIHGNKDHTQTNENGTPNFTHEKPLIITHDAEGVFEWGWRGYGAIQPMNNLRNLIIDGRGYHNTRIKLFVFDGMFSDTCLFVNNGTSDIEMFGIDICGAGFAGIAAKTDPNPNNPFFWRENGWEMHLLIHHINFIGTAGEGVYMGYFNSQVKTGINAAGKEVSYHAHLIRGMRVYRCNWENNGYDSVQINNTTDAEVCYCNIRGSAYRREPNQDAVFSCTFDGKIYNCTAIDNYGTIGVCGPFSKYLDMYNNIFIAAPLSNGMISSHWRDSLNEQIHPDEKGMVGDEFRWHVYNNVFKAAKPLYVFGDILFSNFKAWDNVFLYEDGTDVNQLSGSFTGGGNVCMHSDHNFEELDSVLKIADSINFDYQPAHNSKLVTAGNKGKSMYDMRGYKLWYNSKYHAGPFMGKYKDETVADEGMVYDNIEVILPLAELGVTSADDVAVSFANLKYDKKFVVMWEIDDSLSAPYGAFMKYTHKKWVDYKEAYREFLDKDTGGAKSPKGTGEYGKRVLCHTDGCGNDIPFKYSSGWASLNNMDSAEIHNDTSFAYQYISWRELVKFIEFGNFPTNHGGGDQSNGTTSISNNQAKVLEMAGVQMIFFAKPGGVTWDNNLEDSFAWFAGKRDDASAVSDVDNVTIESQLPPFPPLRIARYFNDSAVYSEYKGIIDQAYASPKKRYAMLANHNIKFDNKMTDGRSKWEHAKQTLDYVYDTYGKGGNDSVWVPSASEFVEYLMSKTLSKLSTSIDGENLVIKGQMLKQYGYYFKQASILLTKSSGTFESKVNALGASDNIVNLANGVKDGKLLINVDYNDKLPGIADKYTTLYEVAKDGDSKYDAVYMCNRLKPSLAKPFLDRIKVYDVPPVLTAAIINAGDETTYNDAVNIDLTFKGHITHYKVSETADLSGSDWMAGTATKIPYTLSSGYGQKKVYVKVMNSNAESEVVSDGIDYKREPVAATMQINGGAANTPKNDVLVKFTVTGGYTSVQYMISEDESFTGCSYADYTTDTDIPFTLSSGLGDKTIYGKVKADSDPEMEVQANITLTTWGVKVAMGYVFVDLGFDASTGINKFFLAGGSRDVKDVSGVAAGKVNLTLDKNLSDEMAGYGTGNDSGVYPDVWITNRNYLVREKTDQSDRFFQFTAVPNGTYRVKIYSNGKDYNANKMTATINAYFKCNGQQVLVADQLDSFVRNFNTYITIEDVQVTDGTITINCWGTVNYPYIPINIVEIEKVG